MRTEDFQARSIAEDRGSGSETSRDRSSAVLNVDANQLSARFFWNDFLRGWRDSRGCWLVLEPSAGIFLPATTARSGIRWWTSDLRWSRMY